MKTTKYFLSMAALALVGAMTVSCSSDDNITDQPQQQEVTKNNVVTLTTTVSLGGDDATRALAADGKKTFAADETMALIYKNKSGNTVKAVSEPLPAGDYGQSATFTFELTDPDKEQEVTYIYPAAMAKDDGTVNYSALNSQNGTLTSLAANLDYCTKSGPWDGDNLPTLTLENQLAILAITLKNEAGTSEITGSTTKLTVSTGSNTYTVNRTAVEGPIYVAILPTSGATIDVIATDGTKNYTKTLTSKTYAASNGYPVSWRMTAAPVADLLDVKFNADGSAVDLSTKGKTVTLCGSTSSVYYSETYQRNVARFTHTWGGDATGYYKVDFESDQAFRNALANGHSLEVLCMANYDGAIPDTEVKPFSAMQGGGTGFLVTKKDNNRQNELCFLPNTSTDGTSTWRWTNCGIVPQKGVFYHIVGVWDKTKSKSYIYVNGELMKEQDAPGNLNFAQTGCNWFCIGGDPNDANTANSAWQGDVAIARVYDKPLTADEAKALWLIDGK